MTSRNVQIMSHRQRITPNPSVTQPQYKNPPSHRKENLSAVDGKACNVNAKQLILYKDDVNSY